MPPKAITGVGTGVGVGEVVAVGAAVGGAAKYTTFVVAAGAGVLGARALCFGARWLSVLCELVPEVTAFSIFEICCFIQSLFASSSRVATIAPQIPMNAKNAAKNQRARDRSIVASQPGLNASTMPASASTTLASAGMYGANASKIPAIEQAFDPSRPAA